MQQAELDGAAGLAMNAHRYERFRSSIERELQHGGVEEIHKPQTPIPLYEQEELAAAAKFRMQFMMTAAGFYCYEDDPPRAIVESLSRNGRTVFRCRHLGPKGPHYFDDMQNRIPRP